MENLSSHIQSQVSHMQQEGGKKAAQLYGAAATGKADEEARRSEDLPEPEERIELEGQQSPDTAEAEGAADQADTLQSGEVQGFAGSEDSVETASGRSPSAGETKTVEKTEALKDADPARETQQAEHRQLQLGLIGNVPAMDIDDILTCKPLPPILDDPFDTHIADY